MKTVKIPTCANPFVVIVNGIKYTYPAGATIEVPDDVAEVIEQHEEAKTEPAPVAPPYSGGMNGDDILAAAKAYTDKKCEGAGDVKVIDMRNYVFSDGTTFNDAIMMLFSGQATTLAKDDDGSFWADVNTDKPIMFVVDGSLMSPGYTLSAPLGFITKNNGSPDSCGFAIVIYDVELGLMKMTFMFTAYPPETASSATNIRLFSGS